MRRGSDAQQVVPRAAGPGCNGGWPEYAANYLVATGIPSDACQPYDLDNTTCLSTCVDGSAKKLFKYSVQQRPSIGDGI